MKTFKTFSLFIAALAIIALSSPSVFSQKKGKDFKNKTPEERAKLQTDMMKSKLSLTADQQGKIEVINLSYAKKFEPIIKSKDSKITRLKQARSLQKAKDSELKKVFTAEQFKTYEKFKDELKSKLKDKM